MDQEKEVQVKKSSPVLWIAIVILVILAALAVWYFTRAKDSEETATTTTESTAATTAKEPKHADWQVYESSKYGFKLYYPQEYTLTPGATGTIKLTKGTVEMADLYVYSTAGDSGGMMKSTTALYTDATKGYMTGGAEADTTVAGQSATMVTGTFGKNAGISQTHAGVKGSEVHFIKNDNLFVLDSYDNADAAAITIFQDMLADMSF